MAQAQPAQSGSYDDIVKLICSELEKENESDITISETTDITTDLSVDSVAIMDLMFALEEEFDVAVPINDLADIRTVKELAELIQKLQA